MLSERVYRWLLVVHPREHRREYGELMVQLFLDRMRRDGRGLGGLIVWLHMVFDLVGAAFEEHKEGVDMRKLASIGIALAAVLIVGGIGVSTLLAQSKDKDEVAITVLEDTKTFTGSESDSLAEAMQQAVQEGEITQATADETIQALQAFEEGDSPAGAWIYEFGADGVAEAMRQAVQEGEITQATADAIARLVDERLNGGLASLSGGKVFVLQDAKTFTGSGLGGVADALLQAVQEGAITQDMADDIAQSVAVGGSANVWRYGGGADGVAGAVRQAVEEGVLSRSLADMIIRSFEDRNTGS